MRTGEHTSITKPFARDLNASHVDPLARGTVFDAVFWPLPYLIISGFGEVGSIVDI
jgi:hypothetical protein